METGERRRLNGGGCYEEVEGEMGNSGVGSRVLEDDQGGRRRRIGGGWATGATDLGFRWACGETEVTGR